MSLSFRRIIASILCFCLLLTAAGCGTAGKGSSEPADVSGGEGTLPESSESGKTAEISRCRLLPPDAVGSGGVSVPYIPWQKEAKVEPYSVKADLSNIENLAQFGGFSAGEKKLLAQNAFVVAPGEKQQLFYIYEKNSYLKIPSFITADSVLQVYHVFYDYSLRSLESKSLLPALERLTDSMLEKSVKIYEGVENPIVKSAALKNAAYFATAALGLQRPLPQDMPAEAKTMAEKEYALIQEQSGFKMSVIFPFKLDYSQFKPRGHYTRSDDFKRYFIAMAWYGQAPFPLYLDQERKIRDVEQTLQALLVTYALFLERDGVQDTAEWEKIYDPTSFYVGKSDDLTIYDYRDLLQKVYGDRPDLEKLDAVDRLDALYEEAKKLPEPKIKAEYTEVDTPVGKQLRFMGQRYLPDSDIIQELVKPIERPIPSGLDVMGVIGSDRAYEIQMSKPENQGWEDYPARFDELRKRFSGLSGDTWRSNMYYGWLWTLQGLTKTYSDGYPSFMTNQAWTDKSLSTALGSWAELRHDTILYGKQSGAERGGVEEPKLLGYVEPAVEVYDKLLWLTEYSRKNLEAKGLLADDDDRMERALKNLENLLGFLKECSDKELAGEDLTDDDYIRVYDYGEYMEALTASFATEQHLKWYEIESETDKNMALAADFHTVAPNRYDEGGYMEAAVGPAHEIFVVVPIGGKLYLSRGAVFSYYEFESDERLTDEQWQQMLKDGKAPAQPSFTGSFLSGGKGEIPEPQTPYNS